MKACGWLQTVIVAVLGLLSASCSSDGTSQTRSTVTDSSGIPIAFTTISSDAPACMVSGEVFRIGAVDEQAGSVLYGVNGAAILADGRIAIVNRGTSEIKLFSANGDPISAFGRQGPGPDEFKSLWSVAVRGPDTLIVGDYRPWRFTFFTATGEFIRRVELSPAVIERPDFALPLGPGSGFIMEEPAFQVQDEMVDRIVPLHTYDENGEAEESAGPFWLSEFGYLAKEIRYVGSPIFGAKASFAPLGGDQFVYATGRHEQLEVWSRSGELRRLIRWQSRDRAVQTGDADAWRRRRRAEMEARFEITPAMEPVIAAQIGPDLPVAEVYPGHDRVLVSQSGDIWVQEYRRPLDEGPGRWWVFSTDGQFVCAASLAEDIRLLAVAERRVIGLILDSLDIEYVLGLDVTYATVGSN